MLRLIRTQNRSEWVPAEVSIVRQLEPVLCHTVVEGAVPGRPATVPWRSMS
jgi:hypothetical protein